MGRVTINGMVAQFSCKRTIPKELWDAKGNKAKGKSMEARETNLALDNIKAQIIKHYQRISDHEAYVTAEMVRNAYQGLGGEYETLLGAFDKENEVFKKRVGKDRVMATYMARVRARNHVAAFIRSHYKRNDISMPELTPDFIKEFAVFLSNEAGLHNGSIWGNCMWLKGVVMRAHFNEHIPRNPFAQFHISPNTKEREFLTENELKALMEFQFKDPKNSYLRDIFVFANFTALSFVDINLNYWSICKRMGKMIKECDITKKISFHIGRHGFATMALCKGMPIESVSRILGHTNIETTQIYAKITVQKLDNDLTTLGDKLNKSFGNVKMAEI